jgi:hypothetical protein
MRLAHSIGPADVYEPVDDLWVISSYFNSNGYKTKRKNYDLFAGSGSLRSTLSDGRVCLSQPVIQTPSRRKHYLETAQLIALMLRWRVYNTAVSSNN